MTTITIERARIEEWFEALSTAKNGLLWFIDSYPQDVNGCDDEAMSEIDMTLEAMSAALAADHALREQVQPEKAFVCSLGCTTECIARQHGVPSECPSLPRQPTQPATAPATTPAQPAWHDAPTVPGMWISDDFEGISTFNSDDIQTFKTNTGVRWYGPIPEDRQ